MKKCYTLLTLLLFSGISIAQQVQELPVSLSFETHSKPTGVQAKTTLCATDTAQYPLAKATGLSVLSINNATSAQAMSQYFNAPQDITISGMTFYAYKIDTNGGATMPVTVSLYLAGNDSMPSGAPLASTTVMVDTSFGGGALGVLEKQATFSTPVTMNAPYVMVMSNNSPNGVGLVFNDYNAGDGDQEWLASADLFGTWTRSYNLNVGAAVFDADCLFYPYVDYVLDADFTPTPPCISDGTTVNFTNNSSPVLFDRMYNQAAFVGVPEASTTWDFDDGNTAQQVSPSNTYTTAGNYDVLLTDTLFGWTTTCVDDTTIALGPVAVANFAHATNNLTVDYTDMSTGGATSWLWDFGDGSTSTLQNPSHTYIQAGTYLVCLTVTNSCGTDINCQAVIAGCTTTNANFTTSTDGLEATFIDMSLGTNIQYDWDFGDGNSSTDPNPIHNYAAAGTYNTCLTIADDCGSDTICLPVTVSCPASWAGFDYTAGSGTTINFMDTSAAAPTSWFWEFGDGTTSTMENPTHTYPLNGQFIVCLTVMGGCGTDSICDTIQVGCLPQTPNFSGTNTQGYTVQFTDLTQGNPQSWTWDFGDGNVGFSQNPMHTYAGVGVYNVCLSTTDSCGAASSCLNVDVIGVGISEADQTTLLLYPSPASDVINMQIDAWKGDLVSVTLFDLTGKVVRSQSGKFNQGANTFSVNGLSAGVYLLRLNNGEQTLTQRVVIQR